MRVIALALLSVVVFTIGCDTTEPPTPQTLPPGEASSPPAPVVEDDATRQ